MEEGLTGPATMGRMPMRRRVPLDEGRTALGRWQAGTDVERSVLATAVRYTLEELGTRAPGRTVEVRVPPYGAVQCVQGPVHTRGTPPNVIETDAQTWLGVVTGTLDWAEAVESGAVRTSGQRTDLGDLLPLL